MIILVCGGRDFNNADLVSATLDRIHARRAITCVVQGGAKGADTLAFLWACENEITCINDPAAWKRYGDFAGRRRNQKMLDWKPRMTLAFPGGTGTADMVRRSHQANIKVFKVGHDGVLRKAV